LDWGAGSVIMIRDAPNARSLAGAAFWLSSTPAECLEFMLIFGQLGMLIKDSQK
jgi:hypothetical protein